MTYKWGGDFIGGNFPRGQFSQQAIFSGEKCWEVIFRGEFSQEGIFIGGIFTGGNFLWGNYLGGNFLGCNF